MSKGGSGWFSGTSGRKVETKRDTKLETTKNPTTPLFSSTGHVSKRSISANRDFFCGKSVEQINGILREQGIKLLYENPNTKVLVQK